MVANHARKKIARRLMAQSRGRLSYTAALGFAAQLGSPAADGFQIELSMLQAGSTETYATASGVEDGLRVLRFARAAMESRHRALKEAWENGAPPPDISEPELIVTISGEHSEVLSEEAGSALKALSSLGRSVGVYSIIALSPSEFRSNLC